MTLVMAFAALSADAEVPGASPSTSETAVAAPPAERMTAPDVGTPTMVSDREVRPSEDSEDLARRFGVGSRLAAIIYEEALSVGIEPALAFGLIAQESGFDTSAIGSQGELGLMQIKPSTARAYDARITPEALLRPNVNVRLGLRHLKREVEYFGDPVLGLMSYHMGRARLERELADGSAPRDRYVERVLSSCGADCA